MTVRLYNPFICGWRGVSLADWRGVSLYNCLENKLLLISINFTPKTSHSCLKKRYTRFSRWILLRTCGDWPCRLTWRRMRSAPPGHRNDVVGHRGSVTEVVDGDCKSFNPCEPSGRKKTGWWQLKYFFFTPEPYLGNMIQFDYIYSIFFQMGSELVQPPP